MVSWIYLFLFNTLLCTCECDEERFLRLPNFDNYVPKDSLYFTKARSKLKCALDCANIMECISFFYRENNLRCYLNHYNIITDNNLVATPGVKYYKAPTRVRTCPYSYTLNSGFCFRVTEITEERLNWTTARSKCVEDGGDLLVMETATEDAIVSGHLVDTEKYYQGIYDIQPDLSYRFVNGMTDKNIGYTNWRPPGAPDGPFDAFDLCGIIRLTPSVGFQWGDGYCSVNRYYICEIN